VRCYSPPHPHPLDLLQVREEAEGGLSSASPGRGGAAAGLRGDGGGEGSDTAYEDDEFASETSPRPPAATGCAAARVAPVIVSNWADGSTPTPRSPSQTAADSPKSALKQQQRTGSAGRGQSPAPPPQPVSSAREGIAAAMAKYRPLTDVPFPAQQLLVEQGGGGIRPASARGSGSLSSRPGSSGLQRTPSAGGGGSGSLSARPMSSRGARPHSGGGSGAALSSSSATRFEPLTQMKGLAAADQAVSGVLAAAGWPLVGAAAAAAAAAPRQLHHAQDSAPRFQTVATQAVLAGERGS
jgi:hypothetical protein